MHAHYPPVQRLACHLENGQRVYWEHSDDPEELREHQRIAAETPPETSLTAWFKVNRHYQTRRLADEEAFENREGFDRGEVSSLDLLYSEMPKHFTLCKSGEGRNVSVTWKPRKRGDRRRRERFGLPPDDCSSDKVARVYAVSPRDREAFYMRLLLAHVRGATCHADLKTFEDTLYPTFVAACRARGLTLGDDEWDECLREANSSASGASMRALLVTIVVHCEPSDPLGLWTRHKEGLCADILHRHRQRRGLPDLDLDDDDAIENEALLELKALFEAADFPWPHDFPTPRAPERPICRRVLEERSFGDTAEKRAALKREVDANVKSMEENNPEQHALFEDIKSTIDSGQGGIFFVDAPAGTGKTFLSKTLLAYVRSGGSVALAAASSGIAATLLPGGRTGHSTFKIPLDPTDTSTCNITTEVDDQTRAVIAAADLILWDEVPMTNKLCFEAVDRTLRLVFGDDRPFAGKVVVFLGDFRQCLPVLKRAARHQIVESALKKSKSIWPEVKSRTLTRNMRVHMMAGPDRERLGRFANFLLDVGNGEIPIVDELGEDWIKIDEHVPCVEREAEVVDKVYGDLATKYDDPEWLFSRAILTPRNDGVDAVNERMIERFPGAEATEILSADEVGAHDDGALFPVEFLNSLTISGMPPHKLRLKVGMPVMLLRNMGGVHCNGTRYILEQIISPKLLKLACWVDGKKHTLYLPRVTLTTKENDFPFELRRRQFPIRPAFAMTINKSQGQTLRMVGILLPSPVFSHGQLYVALSRVGDPDAIILWADDASLPGVARHRRRHPGFYTRNVVYREILR